jgi:hypothetical protein
MERGYVYGVCLTFFFFCFNMFKKYTLAKLATTQGYLILVIFLRKVWEHVGLTNSEMVVPWEYNDGI